MIMDIRHPLKPEDVQMFDWCQGAGLPVHVLLNKADKLSRRDGVQTVQTVQNRYADLVTAQLFSALKHDGVEEARLKLDEWLSAG